MLRHQPPTAIYLPLSNWRQGLGRNNDDDVAQFERALAHYLGVRTCFTAASGRTALYRLLKSLAEASPERSIILLPGYTCPALVKVILDVRLRPFPIDISLNDLTFDPGQLAAHLNQNVLAVIPVHPFGMPQPIEELTSQAHAAGAVVIEDAAQALGARWQGRPVGTVGDFGLFSLGPGKPLSVGGGGVLCTNNEEYARLLQEAWQSLPQATAGLSAWALTRMLLIRLATQPRGWWLAARSGLQQWGLSPNSWDYRRRRLSAAQARVGLAQLSRLDWINAIRQENGRQLASRLQGLDFVHIPQIEAGAEPIYLRLPLLTDTAERREQLYEKLWSANISAGRLYKYPLQEIFPQLDGPPCPNAAQIARRLLTLPTHHHLTPKDLNHITALINPS